MKRTIAILTLVLAAIGAQAQNVYWVFMADKAGSTFDPYTYFDAKALERYRQVGADPNDISNYPVSPAYAEGVNAIATEEVGQSRWLNAMGVVATPEQAARIESLPYVLRVQQIGSDMKLAEYSYYSEKYEKSDDLDSTLTDQLVRMQGGLFRQAGIDGHGVRIAVLDGGFPKVNTHEAFRHLREGKQILKTWNFPNRKEDVYGWNSHGTMTLSCIGGRMNGRDIGLATGAEYLLARTEVEAEPFKEEVWWEMAAEWADKNGANIISSSLGYGKDRYYTKDMDGQSYVARAANMAARKGILVVCSAGNEADDRTWQYIVTPSDADSVLCIGGIEMDLSNYDHINFASFGPSADGRQKPNVCAFAHTWAASPKNNAEYDKVYGTSFSCPLVAGFAACAWQASPGKTNMQMFDLIQRSADLYPYCDYAFGYGVPQASYFTGKARKAEPTFRFEKMGATSVSVIPLATTDTHTYIFYKDVMPDGSIYTYGQRYLGKLSPEMSIDFEGGHRLVVHLDGYTAEYAFDEPSTPNASGWTAVRSTNPQKEYTSYVNLSRTPTEDIADESHWASEWHFDLGTSIGLGGDELKTNFWSPNWHFGLRWQYRFSKAYSLGLGLEVSDNYMRFNGKDHNKLEDLLGVGTEIDSYDKVTRRRAYMAQWGIELFQRVRFVPLGLFHKGFYWDLGVYGSYGAPRQYQLKGDHDGDDTTPFASSSTSLTINNPDALADYKWNYGVVTRLSYDVIGIFARYRLNGIGSDVAADKVLLPRLEVGVQLTF